MDKRIIVLLIIIAILACGLAYSVFNSPHEVNETVKINDTPKNATLINDNDVEDGKYGYCAICGKALSYEEANDEYTQGKVCRSCATNPYYQTEEGAEYANQKLYEAYPDEYSWMYEDTPDSNDYDYDYDDSYYDTYEDYEYCEEDYSEESTE